METSFLAYVRGRLRNLDTRQKLPTESIKIGIGDDAAVIGCDGSLGDQIVCTDQIVDGVDFRLSDIVNASDITNASNASAFTDPTLADIGYKAVAINASDVAAMGGHPTAMLVTLMLPTDGRDGHQGHGGLNATELAAGVYEGILEIAAERSIDIIGGDITTCHGPMAVSVTMLGRLPIDKSSRSVGAWTRGGADVDQTLYVTGPLGGSILGRHFRPADRRDMVDQLRRQATVTAAIDISDGFSLDLDRLLAASGVGVLFDRDAIPVHADAHTLADRDGVDAFRHAWSDGEDFELIVAIKESRRGEVGQRIDGLTDIGVTTSRRGLWAYQGNQLLRHSPQGYVHG